MGIGRAATLSMPDSGVTERCSPLIHRQAGRQKTPKTLRKTRNAQVVELADTGDLKSPGQMRLCGFESRPGHWLR